MGEGAVAGDEAHPSSRISEGHYHNKNNSILNRAFRVLGCSHVPYFVRASQQVCGVEITSLVSWGGT